jgi:hypothetical protein
MARIRTIKPEYWTPEPAMGSTNTARPIQQCMLMDRLERTHIKRDLKRTATGVR